MRPTDRVIHANASRSYGAGEIISILPSAIRPPCQARVLFDGEACARLVWLEDLTPIMTPAPMACSAGALRLIWPIERAGEPVAPVVA